MPDNSNRGDPGAQGETGETGETGIQGAPGAQGQTGQPGSRGLTGATGVGERGPSGDTGEPGHPGIQGIIGLTGVGERGRTGDHGQDGQQGDPGTPGAVGATGPSYRTPFIVIFVFVVLALASYAWYEQGDDANVKAELIELIEAQQVLLYQVEENTIEIENVLNTARYEGCLGGNMIFTVYNAQQNALADIDRRILAVTDSNPDVVALVEERAALYEAGVFPILNCELLLPTRTP